MPFIWFHNEKGETWRNLENTARVLLLILLLLIIIMIIIIIIVVVVAVAVVAVVASLQAVGDAKVDVWCQFSPRIGCIQFFFYSTKPWDGFILQHQTILDEHLTSSS